MIHLGKPAPAFSGTTAYHKGKSNDGFCKISLSDYKGQWLVFFFYPRDWTFICPTELRGFSDKADEFKKLNASILAASTDSKWSHKNWFEKDLPQVPYPILADTTQKISRDYDVLDEDNGESQRGTFIIDPEGIIRYALISAESVGRSVKETLRVLEALQTGERCPMEWAHGGGTLGKA
jgi:peroxiredoxin 2/4